MTEQQENMCQCGHLKKFHGKWWCYGLTEERKPCRCKEFKENKS